MKLSTTVSCTNMHAFDSEGRIRHYENVYDLLRDFFVLRKSHYGKRKVLGGKSGSESCRITYWTN